jgi:putative DNA primase/helicase
METVFGTFKEFYREGESSSALFGILCDNHPDLRGISTADEEELLRELEKELKRQKKHDPEHYKIYDGVKRDGTQKYIGLNYKLFADDLIGIYHFKTLRDTEQMLCYKNGYYQYNGEAIIKEKAEEIFGGLITTHGVNEIIGHVQRSTHVDRDNVDADPTLLNFTNGLYNIKTNEFTQHIPKHIITARIHVKYDQGADCPESKRFLRDIVETEEDAVLLEEILGFCLYRRYFIKKAVMLTGGGDNGKSIYLNMIEHFLGKENCSSIVLQKLTLKDRFTNAFLVGMLANIAGDLSSDALKDTGMFKMLTGGDYVPAEIKGGKIFKFLNSAKMLFSANQIPMTDDLTTAFWTRWIIINFPYKFVREPSRQYEKKRIPEELLFEKLTTPEEMSGLLNLGLDRLKRLLEKREFSYDKSTEEIEEEYRMLSSNMYGFVKEWCITGVDEVTPKSEVYNAYKI